ncbi:DNA topology modulation protein FlaR [Jeotgalibacillus proteolyticus]|uniref:DNA topology modulation protein FlaR n=1 Tax=Jeotgalibacillus proteolyticus TaxID=2082395 RepID=UPI003CE8272A
MKKQSLNKIHIIGSVGSGKTTLAKELSAMLRIPYFELDNAVWIRSSNGDIRRTEPEREEYLNGILQTNQWIVEGIHNEDWMRSSFNEADIIIYLNTRYSIRTYRIIKRFLKQKLRVEKSHYKPTFTIFMKMFKWNRSFEDVGKVNFFTNYAIHSNKFW